MLNGLNGILERAKTKAFDLFERSADLRARVAKAEKPLKDVQQKYYDFGQEQARDPSAIITTEPPWQIQQEAERAKRQVTAAKRAEFDLFENDLNADLGRRFVAEIIPSYEKLAAQMDELCEISRERNKLAVLCGVPQRHPLADEAITTAGFKAWRNRVRRTLQASGVSV